MTIYHSVALNGAEAELYRHLVTEPNGRCAACGQYEPCPVRLSIGTELARAGRLPRRQPGVVGAMVFAAYTHRW
jgi:hypothetical protein